MSLASLYAMCDFHGVFRVPGPGLDAVVVVGRAWGSSLHEWASNVSSTPVGVTCP